MQAQELGHAQAKGEIVAGTSSEGFLTDGVFETAFCGAGLLTAGKACSVPSYSHSPSHHAHAEMFIWDLCIGIYRASLSLQNFLQWHASFLSMYQHILAEG